MTLSDGRGLLGSTHSLKAGGHRDELRHLVRLDRPEVVPCDREIPELLGLRRELSGVVLPQRNEPRFEGSSSPGRREGLGHPKDGDALWIAARRDDPRTKRSNRGADGVR